MRHLLLVTLGGGMGAAARYLVGIAALRTFGPGFPYGTFTVNVTGALAMGLLVGYLAHRGGAHQESLRLLLGVGVLGGFTTFSSYSLEVARMVETKAWGQAGAYAGASVVLCVAGVFCGIMLARRLFA